MASAARIFFAGVGTTFAILAIGFGGGLLIANHALEDASSPKSANTGTPAAVRVVYPSSAEPSLEVTSSLSENSSISAPQPPIQVASPQPAIQTVAAIETPSAVNSMEDKRPKTRRELRAERRKLRAEHRKRKRHADRRARRHLRQLVAPDRAEPGLMAFGGDTPLRWDN